MNVLLSDPGWSTGQTLFLLLLAGHLLGDFAFQTRGMAQGKRRPGVLLGHVIVVTGTHLLLILPVVSVATVAAAGLIGALHGVIDLVKARWPGKRPGALGLFLLDQAAHVLVLAGAAATLHRHAPPPFHLTPETTAGLALGAVVLGAFAFNWTGGGTIVSASLARMSPTLEEEEDRTSGIAGSGWMIGVLERTIALILILAGQWAAIMILLTAKSIARFEELKDRRFAEYYLVGTLTSLLVAILTGLAIRAFLFP